MPTRRSLVLPIAGAIAIAAGSVAAISQAENPSGVSAEVLSRSTYEPFKVSSDHQGPIEFKAQAKTAMDLVIRKHTYAAGGTTGWHQHPGPVFITVTKGTVTFYERDDPSCTPHVVSADKSVSPTNTYVDDGDGHIGRNETGEPAEDISIITAPVGGPFRTNLPKEGSSCSF